MCDMIDSTKIEIGEANLQIVLSLILFNANNMLKGVPRILLSLFIFFYINSNGQKNLPHRFYDSTYIKTHPASTIDTIKPQWGVRFGMDFGKMFELGLGRWKLNQKTYRLTDVCLSNVFLDRNSYFNPKLSVEYMFALTFASRLNLVYYNYPGENDIVFRPEIGFNLFALGTFYYGYNFKSRNKENNGVPQNPWSFNFNIPIASKSGVITKENTPFQVKKKYAHWGLVAGVRVNSKDSNGVFELGVMRCCWSNSDWISISDIALTNEFNSAKEIFNPKIGAKASFLFFTTRLSFVDYIHAGEQDIRLRPEVGFSPFGLIDCLYGNDIFLTHTRAPNIDSYGWSFTLHLPFDFFSRK